MCRRRKSRRGSLRLLPISQTRGELAALTPDDPHAAELARSAREAFDSGRLTEPDALLDRAKEAVLGALRQAHQLKQKAQEAEERHALNAAKLLGGRGNIALTQLRYVDAAEHFKQAASLVPSGNPDETAAYFQEQAFALYRQGGERGDNAALEQSVEIWRHILQYRSRDRVPLDWAATQVNLGAALEELAERESRTVRLEEAVVAYRLALEEWPDDTIGWLRVKVRPVLPRSPGQQSSG
jgi:tetratricopeptide (TPR) repeat protein